MLPGSLVCVPTTGPASSWTAAESAASIARCGGGVRYFVPLPTSFRRSCTLHDRIPSLFYNDDKSCITAWTSPVVSFLGSKTPFLGIIFLSHGRSVRGQAPGPLAMWHDV
jgi:hypothetical protein